MTCNSSFHSIVVFRIATRGTQTHTILLHKITPVKMNNVYGVAKEMRLSAVTNAVTPCAAHALNRILGKKHCHVFAVKVSLYSFRGVHTSFMFGPNCCDS